MAARNLFLVSSANAYLMSHDDELIATAKTLSDTSFEMSLSNTDIRGGQGNALLYVYYHSPDGNVTLTDPLFNFDFLALNLGSQVEQGANMFAEETVSVTNGAGTVVGTPLGINGNTTKYGYVTYLGDTERVAFVGQNFTMLNTGVSGDVVVRYLQFIPGARQITINSSILPSNIKLILEGILASSNTSGSSSATNKVGTMQMQFDSAQMTGSVTLSMTADGVSTTPLNVRLLATEGASGGAFGRIIEYIIGDTWYKDVTGLGVIGSDDLVVATGAQYQLQVKAINKDYAFTPQYQDLTFAATGAISVDANGLVTGAAGGGTIKVSITAKPQVSITFDVADA